MIESGLFEYISLVSALLLFVSLYFNFKLFKKLKMNHQNSRSLIKNAYFNDVTELPNLANIELVISEQMERARRHNKKFIITAMRVDNYFKVKAESESMAHSMMHEAANRLLNLIREEDIVGHIEEDMFLIVFNEYLEDANYTKIVDRISKLFIGEPHLNDNLSLDYHFSLGCAEYPEDGTTVESLISRAKSKALK